MEFEIRKEFGSLEKSYLYRHVFLTDREKANFPKESFAGCRLFHKQSN